MGMQTCDCRITWDGARRGWEVTWVDGAEPAFVPEESIHDWPDAAPGVATVLYHLQADAGALNEYLEAVHRRGDLPASVFDALVKQPLPRARLRGTWKERVAARLRGVFKRRALQPYSDWLLVQVNAIAAQLNADVKARAQLNAGASDGRG